MTPTETATPENGDINTALTLHDWGMALFDRTTEAHQMPASMRSLLELAIGFYSATKDEDSDQRARSGRDLALAAPIPNSTPERQAIVASAIALQRDKPRPRREPALIRLDGHDRKQAVRLAAILQMARTLASDSLEGIRAAVADGTTTLVLDGEHADTIVAEAEGRAGLWRAHIGDLLIRPSVAGDLLIRPASMPAPELPFAIEPPSKLTAEEPVIEGGRRVLRNFFARMLMREDAVLKSDDPEDVHQMRVASRRLRAALQIAEPMYAAKRVRSYRRGLRQVAQALADLRDLDVLLAHLHAYAETLEPEARADLAPILEAFGSQRSAARATLRDDLRQRRFIKFKHAFAAFLTTPGAEISTSGDIGPQTRVRDFAGSAIWRRYEQWREHEGVLQNTNDNDLHQARIAGKRLRYTLEFFADALGPRVAEVLAPLISLQECLGTMQDSVVARQRLHSLGLDESPAAQAYLSARETEHAAQLDALPRLWEKVGSATYRRRLFELIVKM